MTPERQEMQERAKVFMEKLTPYKQGVEHPLLISEFGRDAQVHIATTNGLYMLICNFAVEEIQRFADECAVACKKIAGDVSGESLPRE